MKAEILCIGTELLIGQTQDTNSHFLSKKLAELGIDLYHKTTVGDNLPRMVEEMQRAWNRSDIIVLTGGLGPTTDDLTREAIACLLGEKLEFRNDVWEKVQTYMAKRGREITENNRRQAMFPPTAVALDNIHGTAPAVLVQKDEKILFAFPGVPRELYALWDEHALPLLKEKSLAEGNNILTSRILRLYGIGESAMENEIMDLFQHQEDATIAPYVGRGDVLLRLTTKGSDEQENLAKLDVLQNKVFERLGEYVYGFDDDTLESTIGELLKKRNQKLAVAESCTGGLLANKITNVPGSSEYYLGGVNSYSNEMKQAILGVKDDTLRTYGAVSEQTAAEMAEGVRRIIGADVALSTTGIAGPGGGTAEKPVGLVYIALATPQGTQVVREVYPYDRVAVKDAATQRALGLLWNFLK